MKNENSKRKYFALGDIFIATVVLLCFVLSLVFLFDSRNQQDVTAVISVEGEVYHQVKLSDVEEPYEVRVNGEVPVIISLSPQGVCFSHSDCPDKLCVNTGVLTHSGQSAVCLPARVSVKLVSESMNDMDAPDSIAG